MGGRILLGRIGYRGAVAGMPWKGGRHGGCVATRGTAFKTWQASFLRNPL